MSMTLLLLEIILTTLTLLFISFVLHLTVDNLVTSVFFLGMEVSCTPGILTLSQAHYASNLLKKFQIDNCKPCSTPCVPGSVLSAAIGVLPSNITTYRSMVGGLQYLTLTRLDICFVVNQVCQFLHQPWTAHLQVVKHIYRYIKGTIAHGLSFRASDSLMLTAFSNSDWAGNLDNRRSTTGACIFLVPIFLLALLRSNCVPFKH